MDIKSLAKALPLYGQMAVGSALKALGVAGYLRHVRCRGGEGDQVRWVTLTFWSRTARDNEWWDAFLTAEDRLPAPESAAPSSPAVPTEAAAPAPVTAPVTGPVAVPVAAADAVPVPAATVVPQQRTPAPAADAPSPAYLALAQLGRVEPRLSLSAADCDVLEAQAAEWFARGVDTHYLTHALTSGLPARVDSPVGFVRRRLSDKMPPHLPVAPVPAGAGTPVRRVMVECTGCGAPGRPDALPDGLCRPCRQPAPAPPADVPPIERDIRAHVGHLRGLLRLP
jgi:hypothetical protein